MENYIVTSTTTPVENLTKRKQELTNRVDSTENDYHELSSDNNNNNNSNVIARNQEISNIKRSSEYESPDIIEDIVRNSNSKQVSDLNPRDLYSVPKMFGSEKDFSLNDDDEPPYIKVPTKNFDPGLIYDTEKSEYYKFKNNENKNEKKVNKNNSDYYYSSEIDNVLENSVPTTPNRHQNNNNNDPFINQKNSHYEVVPEYEIISHMTNDNNVSRLNIDNNNVNNIRNIIVGRSNATNYEENYYSNIEATGTASNENILNNNNIQFVDINNSGKIISSKRKLNLMLLFFFIISRNSKYTITK